MVSQGVSVKSLDNAKVPVMIQLPIALMVEVEKRADELEVNKSALIRQIVADSFGFKLAPSQLGRARVYATDEERKNAQKLRNEAKRNVINKMLEAMRNGGEQAAIELLQSMQNQTEEDTDEVEETEES